MTLDQLNSLDNRSLILALERCCGAFQWVESMAGRFPFSSKDELLSAAEEIWRKCSKAEWKQAFLHHPKIGDLQSLREKFASTSGWASGEQSGVNSADDLTLKNLQAANEVYHKKFGYIYIVYATGKSAAEMLALLESRLGNDPETEIHIAMEEQLKITKLRLEKLLS